MRPGATAFTNAIRNVYMNVHLLSILGEMSILLGREHDLGRSAQPRRGCLTGTSNHGRGEFFGKCREGVVSADHHEFGVANGGEIFCLG